MTKSRIAILGGGMAGLTAAYELTKTSDLRARHDVTIYQMGWRLGGKAASGRDKKFRNIEHGLHVWFGCYENSFRLLQEVYGCINPGNDSRFKIWTDAFKPQNRSAIGARDGDKWVHLAIDWPVKGGFPGDGIPASTLWGAITVLIGMLKNVIDEKIPGARSTPVNSADVAFHLVQFHLAMRSGPPSPEFPQASRTARSTELSLSDLFSAAHLWAAALDDQVAQNHKDQLPHIARLFTAAETLLKASVPLGSRRPATQLILEAADVLAAIIRGVINDILLPNSPLESLDAVDFRDWLVKHGANNKVVRESGIVRTWYDMSFQYRDGIQTQPSCAAGSCLGAVLRVLGTYKESVAYLPQGGFGEVVVAPLYRALLQAGVQIKFFRKVTGVELSADGQRIGRIQLDRQADIRVGDYAPTKRKSGFDYWPSQPFWEQIIDGGAMQAAGVDFESHWCDREPAGQEILEYGEDFDVVVLALPLGAYKEFPGQRSICEGILRRSSQFAQYVRDVEITPTLVMQIWSDWSLEALGSRIGKAVSVSGPPFLDIWADMSQILGLEEGQKTAQTLHYLCGSFPSKMYQWPATARDTPEKARREAYKCALEWLQRCSYALWPSAQDRGGFRWEVLTAPVSEKGEARLQYQFVNANIDPAACCTTSFAGTTQARLGPCETGITNLVLAGEGCRHGFNATAVEGAVMSGMAASRAICGEPAEIFGYDYLQREPFDS